MRLSTPHMQGSIKVGSFRAPRGLHMPKMGRVSMHFKAPRVSKGKVKI